MTDASEVIDDESVTVEAAEVAVVDNVVPASVDVDGANEAVIDTVVVEVVVVLQSKM